MAVNLRQNADGSLSMLDEGTSLEVGRWGGPATRVGGAAATNTNVPNFRGLIYITCRVQGPTDTAGGLCAVANPFGVSVNILAGGQLAVTTQSAGACTAQWGVGATSTTSAATLFAAATMAATGLFTTIGNVTWSTTQFITGSTATGASSGLVGTITVPVFIP